MPATGFMRRFCTRWGEPRFVCDVHLAKVARLLRTMGFDTLWREGLEDEELLALTRCGRIGLTCDRKLWERGCSRILLLAHGEATEQTGSVAARLGLGRWAVPLRRSLCCNRPVVPLSKERAMGRMPVRSYRWVGALWICPACRRLYWRGTHAEKMAKNVLKTLSYGKTDKILGDFCEEEDTRKMVTPRGLEPL